MDKKEIIIFLKKNGKEIGKRGINGCDICKNIMKYYQMLYSCWDGMTQVLIETQIEEYNEKYNVTEKHQGLRTTMRF